MSLSSSLPTTTTTTVAEPHTFSLSSLESMWDTTTHSLSLLSLSQHAQAGSTTTTTAKPWRTSATATSSITKPPLSPQRRYASSSTWNGRPPLSPVSTMHTSTFDESVETVMLSSSSSCRPSSSSDVRLFVVRDLNDLPNLYDCYAPQSTESVVTVSSSDTHSLEFTHDTTTSVALPLSHNDDDDDDDDDDEDALLGLDYVTENNEEPPTVVQLDLDFLQQDPPQAHAAGAAPFGL